MKLFTSLLSRLYTYATVCIVIGSPLFFVPHTVFAPETTYFITLMILVAIAISAYVILALINKSWHLISKFEFLSYTAFCCAVLLSSIFSRGAYKAFFGESLSTMSGISLISLPVIMYLVSSLSDTIRRKLKYVVLAILGVSSFIFITGFMFTGKLSEIANQLLSGFSNAVSTSVYLSIFAIVCFFFAKKAFIPVKHKVVIVVAAVVFLVWAVSFSFQDNIRPNFSSTVAVGGSVMLNEGPFGIGSGNFSRAWQLYRPQNVIASPYFGYDFNQGADTMTTLFVTIGIVGLLSFLMLVLSSLYVSYNAYRRMHVGTDHFILGLMTIVLLYFTLVAWEAPLTYSMLVMWMVLSGFGVAKAQSSENQVSKKKLAMLMIPVAVLLLINACILVQKAQAFALYRKASEVSSNEQAMTMNAKAMSIYPYDGFYRTQVEYAVQSNRALVAMPSLSKEDLKNKYLENTKIAIDSAREAVKINPDNYQNYVSLGRAYELAIPFSKNSEYGNARQAYEAAVKLYPGNPYLYVMLARLEASAGTKEGVRADLTEALKKKQNFADALYLMSQLEASDQKIDEALAYAIEAIKNAPNDPLVYVQAGLLFYGKEDYGNAYTTLATAWSKDPGNIDVAYFLAVALRDGGRLNDSRVISNDLIKRDPNNSLFIDLSKSLDELTSTSTIKSLYTSTSTPSTSAIKAAITKSSNIIKSVIKK